MPLDEVLLWLLDAIIIIYDLGVLGIFPKHKLRDVQLSKSDPSDHCESGLMSVALLMLVGRVVDKNLEYEESDMLIVISDKLETKYVS